MRFQRLSAWMGKQAQVSRTATTVLAGGWLLIARVGWIVLTLLILTFNVVTLPSYNAVLQAPCQSAALCVGLQLSAYDHHLLHQLSLSLGFVAGYEVALNVIVVVVYCTLGALIFWRKSGDRMALFCAFVLVLAGGVGNSNILSDTLMPASPIGFALVGALNVLGQSGFVIFFLLFPNGRFVPRWTRWVALCTIVYWIYIVFSASVFFSASFWSNFVFFSILFCVVGVQIYRYRRVSTSRERQQTKWVVSSRPNGLSLASVWGSWVPFWPLPSGTPCCLQPLCNRA